MKFSLYFTSLIAISVLPKTYSQKTKKIPGCAGCGFYGATIRNCGELIAASKLPAECEALYYFWIHTDNKFKLLDTTGGVSNKEYIKDLDSLGKPLFLYYGRASVDDWLPFLENICKDGGVNLKKEMTNLQTYLDSYKNTAGIILNNLTPEPNTAFTLDTTKNFKYYLDELKKAIPNYSIGLEILSFLLIDMNKNSKPPVWLDFSVLDPSIDYYVLDLFYFNDCTPDFKIGGATPINGTKGRTLEQLVDATKKLGLTQNKIYFAFRSGATNVDPSDQCQVTNTKMCTRKSLDGFCADNTQSYFDKGAFVKKNGHGFLLSNMDLADDANGKCQCETPFPGFHDVLAGFKSLPVPKPCPLLDKC